VRNQQRTFVFITQPLLEIAVSGLVITDTDTKPIPSVSADTRYPIPVSVSDSQPTILLTMMCIYVDWWVSLLMSTFNQLLVCLLCNDSLHTQLVLLFFTHATWHEQNNIDDRKMILSCHFCDHEGSIVTMMCANQHFQIPERQSFYRTKWLMFINKCGMNHAVCYLLCV